MSQDEQDLIRNILAGSSEAFEQLISPYSDRLFNTLAHILRNAEAAEDVLQDALLQAFVKLNTYQGKSAFYTWLYRVAVNRWKDWRISMSRRREDIIEEMFDRTPGPFRTEASLEAKEAEEILSRALQELPDLWRQVIVLREIDDLSYDEVASVLSCSTGTVKSRLFRARSRLKDILLRNNRSYPAE